MTAAVSAVSSLTSRQNSGGKSDTDQFLDLIADPFQSQIQANSIYAALVWSFAVSGGLFLAFVLLRPRISHVYARRSKHADEKHAPIRLEKTLLGWVPALKTSEEELVEKIGLDAVVFLRFLRMLRSIFIILTVVGCATIIPVNLVGAHGSFDQYGNVSNLLKLTPQYSYGKRYWAYVVLSYIFQGIVCALIWWNYRTVLRLRQIYFRSKDYVDSLHARTLLVRHVPQDSRSDSGIAEAVFSAASTDEVPHTVVGRNVRKWHLPQLVADHDESVKSLEKYLAKYLADPAYLPAQRPTCKPGKGDTSEASDSRGKVDAISYLEERRIKLAKAILEARQAVSQRDPEPYGFASYESVEQAHVVAHEYRYRKAKGKRSAGGKKSDSSGVSIQLSPKPQDLIWQNLPMSYATRRNRAFWDSLWMILLTVLFIGPNILTSVFLSDFSHLGQLWPAFQDNLAAHPLGWGIAQGVIAPGVQFLFYLVLPAIFRRILTHSGDPSRTSRERHVTSRLYAFFVVNQLIVFSIFATVVRYVATVVAAKDQSVWEAINNGHLFTQLMTGLCSVSTFWLTFQMQQNLSAAMDLSQLISIALAWFQKRFMHPTPRQLIELSAPSPIDYAGYYNAYLFSSTVGLCFATLQPIILPVTAFFMVIEYYFKKYLVQYVFFSKTESGGAFWRMNINRLLFGTLLSNAVVALIVGSQGVGASQALHNGGMLYAMVPLPFLLFGFKYYLLKSFDTKMGFIYPLPGQAQQDGLASNEYSDSEAKFSTPTKRAESSLSVKFGHPALYDPLIAPMVHARSQHLVDEVLGHSKRNDSLGRVTYDHWAEHSGHSAPTSGSGIPMPPLRRPVGDQRTSVHTGPAERADGQYRSESATALVPRVVIVTEGEPDVEQYKDRPEFRDEFGGEGQLFGEAEDAVHSNASGATTASEREHRGDATGSNPGAMFDALNDAIRPGVQMSPSGGLR